MFVNGDKMRVLHRIICFVLLSMLALLPVIYSTEGYTFGPQVDVTDEDSDPQDIDVTSSGSGGDAMIYAVHEDMERGPSKPDVVFRRSKNGGSSFSFEENFMSSPYGDDRQMDPCIDVHSGDGGDILVIGYIDNSFGSNGLEYHMISRTSYDNGSTWSQPVMVTNNSMSGYPNDDMKDPDICFDPRGNLFLVWTEKHRLRITWSTDNGSNWSIPEDVVDHPNPQNLNYYQEVPSMAAGTSDIVIAFQSDQTYKKQVYTTNAKSDGNLTDLVFSDPVLLPEIVYPMYRTYSPKVDHESGAYHITWWDFQHDPNGNNNEDPNRDRPGIGYTRSVDGGNTWSVGSEKMVYANSSAQNIWHSPPDISAHSSTGCSITFMDLSSGLEEIYVTSTSDGGSTWKAKDRVNEYWPDISRESPRITVDAGGEAHVMWLENDEDERQLIHSSSIVDGVPAAVTYLRTLSVNERNATIGWKINREPDFSKYESHLSNTLNFSVSPSTTVNTTGYQGTDRVLLKGLSPDTRYFFKVVCEDQGGNRNKSDELSFVTPPTNKAPSFTRNISTFTVDEGSRENGALNLSDWIDRGWIVDDGYGGHTDLSFTIIGLENDDMVDPGFRDRNVSNPFWIMDILTTNPDWTGTASFKINVSDKGKDGGFGSPDDMWSHSGSFDVVVTDVNDIPAWSVFHDLNTGWQTPIAPRDRSLVLEPDETGCLEGNEYRFSISGKDADGDLLTFSFSDDRFHAKPDLFDPHITSEVSFTPGNEDVPLIMVTVNMTDGRGGYRHLDLTIPVENVNQAPSFASVNDHRLDGDNPLYELDTIEGDNITLLVTARDPDINDGLVLSSKSERAEFRKLCPRSWNVTVRTFEGDHSISPLEVELNLYDRMMDHASLTLRFHVADRQNPVRWIDGKERIEVDPIYDKKDPNEEKEHGKFGGEKIQAEWNENVSFRANAFDPDGDLIHYDFTITDMDGTVQAEYTGRIVVHSFTPSLGALNDSEKFRIRVHATDGNFQGIQYIGELWVHPDIDNDNDGLVDELEIAYFSSLDNAQPGDDPDNDGLPNIMEIGVDTSIHTNPTVSRNWTPGGNSNTTDGKEKRIPEWILVAVVSSVLLLFMITVGVALIVRRSRVKERREEEEINRRVKSMEEKAKNIDSLYASREGEEDLGPDQTTLSDLRIDTGGHVYHEKGSPSSHGIRSGSLENKEKVESIWKRSHGPLFQDKAEKPIEGERLNH